MEEVQVLYRTKTALATVIAAGCLSASVIAQEPPATGPDESWISLSGTVTSTTALLYNPLDDQGFQQIDEGDRVSVEAVLFAFRAPRSLSGVRISLPPYILRWFWLEESFIGRLDGANSAESGAWSHSGLRASR